MKNKNTLISVALLVVGLGAGFFGGFKFRNYQLSKVRNALVAGGINGTQRYVGTGRTGTTSGMMRGGNITGSILSMDDKSMTVKLSDGSTKIVLFSGSTTYSNTTAAKVTDIKVGNEIQAFGATNSDGSITATSVQINPITFRPQASPTPGE